MKFHHKYTEADYDASPLYLLWSRAQTHQTKPNTRSSWISQGVSSSQLPHKATTQTAYVQFNWFFF